MNEFSAQTEPSIKITPEMIAKGKEEVKVANKGLLDQMEASANEKGQYFVKLGGKREDGGDPRSFLLRESISDQSGTGQQWTIVTQDGALSFVTKKQEDTDNVNGFISSSFRGYSDLRGDFDTGHLGGGGLFSFNSPGKSEKKSFQVIHIPTNEDVKEAIRRSQDAAARPDQLELINLHKKLEATQDLTAFVIESRQQI